jgi:hypothetical protein
MSFNFFIIFICLFNLNRYDQKKIWMIIDALDIFKLDFLVILFVTIQLNIGA